MAGEGMQLSNGTELASPRTVAEIEAEMEARLAPRDKFSTG